MVEMACSELVDAVKGKGFGSSQLIFRGLSTDSRAKNLQGQLFIPLRGDNFDGHDFIPDALAAGAAVVIVDKPSKEWPRSWKYGQKVTFIEVKDTLVALQTLGQYWRRKQTARILALTGSNGKTTTKDFLAQLLSSKFSVISSQGSFNNHWGVPLTLASIKPQDEFAVVEMGMNHRGEIRELCKMAEPDVVAVTNIGRAHLGFFSGIEEIAQAKEEIYQYCGDAETLIFNLDNPWTQQMVPRYADKKMVGFSTQKDDSDVYLHWGQKGSAPIVQGLINGVSGESAIHFWGQHNLENLCCAVAMATACGMKPEYIWQAMDLCQTGWGRNQWLELASGGKAIFDGYNANPDSFQALIDNLKTSLTEFETKIGFFGEMLELGANSEPDHFDLGQKLAQLPWSKIIFIGPSGPAFQQGWQEAGGDKSLMILNSYEESLDLDLETMVDAKSLVVVKGSRGQKLERMIKRLSPKNF